MRFELEKEKYVKRRDENETNERHKWNGKGIRTRRIFTRKGKGKTEKWFKENNIHK